MSCQDISKAGIGKNRTRTEKLAMQHCTAVPYLEQINFEKEHLLCTDLSANPCHEMLNDELGSSLSKHLKVKVLFNDTRASPSPSGKDKDMRNRNYPLTSSKSADNCFFCLKNVGA